MDVHRPHAAAVVRSPNPVQELADGCRRVPGGPPAARAGRTPWDAGGRPPTPDGARGRPGPARARRPRGEGSRFRASSVPSRRASRAGRPAPRRESWSSRRRRTRPRAPRGAHRQRPAARDGPRACRPVGGVRPRQAGGSPGPRAARRTRRSSVVPRAGERGSVQGSARTRTASPGAWSATSVAGPSLANTSQAVRGAAASGGVAGRDWPCSGCDWATTGRRSATVRQRGVRGSVNDRSTRRPTVRSAGTARGSLWTSRTRAIVPAGADCQHGRTGPRPGDGRGVRDGEAQGSRGLDGDGGRPGRGADGQGGPEGCEAGGQGGEGRTEGGEARGEGPAEGRKEG